MLTVPTIASVRYAPVIVPLSEGWRVVVDFDESRGEWPYQAALSERWQDSDTWVDQFLSEGSSPALALLALPEQMSFEDVDLTDATHEAIRNLLHEAVDIVLPPTGGGVFAEAMA